jgi:amino acid transporter
MTVVLAFMTLMGVYVPALAVAQLTGHLVPPRYVDPIIGALAVAAFLIVLCSRRLRYVVRMIFKEGHRPHSN